MRYLKFCPNCNNFLIPKNGKLFCKICDKSFDLTENEENNYIIVKNLNNEDIEPAIIFEDDIKFSRISKEDRETFEDYFKSST